MSAKTMTEVLAEHGEWRYTNGAGSDIVCRKCGAPVENVVEHQAAVMSAAGFGLVADAKAEALAAIHTVPPISHGIDADARFANGYNEALRRVRAAVAAAKGDERG